MEERAGEGESERVGERKRVKERESARTQERGRRLISHLEIVKERDFSLNCFYSICAYNRLDEATQIEECFTQSFNSKVNLDTPSQTQLEYC